MMGYHVTNVITSRRMFLQSKNHWNVLCKGKTDQCATYRFFFQSMLLPFVTFWKLFKMLLCTRNRFCWPGRVTWVSRTEICFAWRNFKWQLKKCLEGVRVTSNYNGLCCSSLKLSPSSLKKTILSKKDFESVYNWVFWMYDIRGNERVNKS